MKKIFNLILEFIGHFLIYLTCYFNLPLICSYLIRISLLKNKFSINKIKSKKIVIVLDRAIGHRDIEIIKESSSKAPEFLFLRRSITKIILFYFSKKRKFFFNYLKPNLEDVDYFNQSKIYKKKHEDFWKNIMFYIKKNYKNKSLNIVTFNYTYFAETALYDGCLKNNIPVKLWYKEGIKTALEAKQETKSRGYKYRRMFSYFHSIAVYNNLVKDMFVKIDKSNKKKILVIGSPRLKDYIIKKKYNKKVQNLLFLSFGKKRGIPNNIKNKKLNWSHSYGQVLEMLNKLSRNKNINITIKMKSNSKVKINNRVRKNIKIFSTGTAEKLINQSDIVIGQNSASTIEALVNGKYVLVPFFEKNNKMRKYLYNFNNEIIYSNRDKMVKRILSLINKKVTFPINNIKHTNTIRYYLGNSIGLVNKYLKFLAN